MRAYAYKDPQAAADLAAQQPSGSALNQAISAVASSWVQADSPAAVAWIQSLPDGAAKRTALNNAFFQVVWNNPAGAADLLASLPVTQDNMGLYWQLGSQWAQSDVAAAVNWAKQLPEGTTIKQTVLQNISSVWAQSDPSGADGRVYRAAGLQRADLRRDGERVPGPSRRGSRGQSRFSLPLRHQ